MTSPGASDLVAGTEQVRADRADGAERPGLLHRFKAELRSRLRELARFGSVGAVAFLVDMGMYNLLRFGPIEFFTERPLTARVLAVAVSTTVSWLGNRHWTFADRRSGRHGREFLLFAGINLVGIGITVGALAFSHYVLGLSGPLSDNIANVVGIGLGTIARYIGYRLFVFTGTADLVKVAHEVHQGPGAGAPTTSPTPVVPVPAAPPAPRRR